MILLKIDIPSLWVLGDDEEKNLENLQANLDLVKEVRSDVDLRAVMN